MPACLELRFHIGNFDANAQSRHPKVSTALPIPELILDSPRKWFTAPVYLENAGIRHDR
jgi:hypothetical protein